MAFYGHLFLQPGQMGDDPGELTAPEEALAERLAEEWLERAAKRASREKERTIAERELAFLRGKIRIRGILGNSAAGDTLWSMRDRKSQVYPLFPFESKRHSPVAVLVGVLEGDYLLATTRESSDMCCSGDAGGCETDQGSGSRATRTVADEFADLFGFAKRFRAALT